tara:strand:- start:9 stop:1430 length:1422 start_codon:yes stop_codon:yes gene_type:complete
MSLTKVSYSMIQGAPVNILDYGASASSSNNSVAIQAALDTGLDVYVPSGDFVVTDTLTMKTAYQNLFGVGQASKITFNFSSIKAGLVLDENGATNFAEKSRIHDLYLYGSANVLMVIHVKASTTRIYDNRIVNASAVVGHGIYCAALNESTAPFVKSFGHVISNNNIYGNNVTGSVGIVFNERNHPAWVQNNNIGVFDTLIEVAGTEAMIDIKDNYLEPAKNIGVDLNSSNASSKMYNITIQNNYFEECPIAVRLKQGASNCLKIVDNYSYPHTQTSAYGVAPFFWAATTGAAATTASIVENNTIDGHSSLFLLDDEYNSRLASTKNNVLISPSVWATGTYANNAYKIRQFNSYFTKRNVSGVFLGEDTARLESKDAVFSIPIQFEPHQKMWKLETNYAQTGSTGVTIELFKSTSGGITATSLGSATRTTDGLLTITLDNYSAEPNYNYYLTVTYSNTGTSGYIYPFQLYLYE